MRLSEGLQKYVAARNQALKTKKFTNYKANASMTRVSSTQYLKDAILDKKTRVGTGGMCLGDMQVMLDCMKLNDFDENTCVQEIMRHRDCVAREKALKAELNARGISEELGGEGRLNTKQANKLLRMFPQPQPQFYFTHLAGKQIRKPWVVQYNRDEAPYVPLDIYKKSKKS